jgi:aromatic ring-cleaving dioxygenase
LLAAVAKSIEMLPTMAIVALLLVLARAASQSTEPQATWEIPCFHVHVYFLQTSPKSVEAALRLRGDMIQSFSFDLSRPCEAEVNDFNCMWRCYDPVIGCLNMEAVGPHPVGSWAASLTPAEYGRVIPWLWRQGNALDDLAGVLIHPLTAARGADDAASRRRDHELGFWRAGGARGAAGGLRVLPVNYDFLSTNVYDCDVCDRETCTQACLLPRSVGSGGDVNDRGAVHEHGTRVR